jgi:hypothetical protein
VAVRVCSGLVLRNFVSEKHDVCVVCDEYATSVEVLLNNVAIMQQLEVGLGVSLVWQSGHQPVAVTHELNCILLASDDEPVSSKHVEEEEVQNNILKLK